MIADQEAPEAALAPQTENEKKLAEIKVAFTQLAPERLADILDSISSSLDERDRKHREATAYDRAVLSVADAVLREKIVARFPKKMLDEQAAETRLRLPHDELDVEIRIKRRLDKRISDLRKLEGKIPKAEFDAAVWLDVTERVSATEYDVLKKRLSDKDFAKMVEGDGDARMLKKIAKEYGTDVAKIIERGLVYVQQGAMQLTVTRKSSEPVRNVTGTASPAIAGDA